MWFLKQRKILINLLIMIFIWLTSSFDYFLIMFLVNTFQRVYICAIASSISELFAYAISGYFYSYFGAKMTLTVSFAISTVGGVVILAYGLQHEEAWTFVLLVILSKFGIACAMNINFVAHQAIFPPLFASAAMGYCGVLSRLFSTLSPLLAQMDEPLPMICFTITAALSCFLSLFLQTDIKQKNSGVS